MPPYMSDEQLAKYFPAYGDRVALMAFAKSKLKKNESSSGATLANSTLHQLRRRRYQSRQIGNKNAQKKVRKLELGWLNFTSAQLYKQVRAKNGGGTRHFPVDKNVNVTGILHVATATFFPGGVSKLGDVSDFLCEIKDFKGDTVPDEKTIEDLYKESQLRTLRLYLYTRPREFHLEETAEISSQTNGTDSSEDELPSPPSIMVESRSSTVTTTTARASSTLVLPTPVTPQSNTSTSQDRNCQELVSPDPEVTFHPRHRLSLRRRTQEAPAITSPQHRSRGTEQVPEVMEVLDSEDEELQLALLESLDHPANSEAGNQRRDNVSVNDILKTFQETVNDENVTKLLVMRTNVLDTAIKSLDRKALDLSARLYVKFSGELGQDHGGPRREFFRLVIKALHESPRFFEGPESGKIFAHSIILLEKGHFRVIGRLTAMSLAQDGPGLHFLSGDLYDMMVGRKSKLTEVEQLLPEDMKTMIQQLREADSYAKEDSFLVTYGDQLIDMGLTNVYQIARESKESLIEMIKKHHIYYRTSGEISQFISGVNDVKRAWDMITSYPDLFKPIFCCKPKEITVEDMLTIFKVNYSEPGSNNKALEDNTIFGWESFLQSIEERQIEVTFSEVLVFVTGADHIPPCGFSKLIDVDFYTSDGRLPSASTCALQLWLPRVTDPDMISTAMIRASKESYGFMKV